MKGFSSFKNQINRRYLKNCQIIGAYLKAPPTKWNQTIEVFLGVFLIFWGTAKLGCAQSNFDPEDVDQSKLQDAIQILMTYIEGPFGALVAVCSGLGAILSCAFGQYRASLSFLIVAIGSFILRAFVKTFFKIPDVIG